MLMISCKPEGRARIETSCRGLDVDHYIFLSLMLIKTRFQDTSI
jgi:hypothetical protein